MSKKNKKNKKQAKDTVRPNMPVVKPEASHMPICTAPGCMRKVNDARKSRCTHCGHNAPQWDDYAWDMYD